MSSTPKWDQQKLWQHLRSRHLDISKDPAEAKSRMRAMAGSGLLASWHDQMHTSTQGNLRDHEHPQTYTPRDVSEMPKFDHTTVTMKPKLNEEQFKGVSPNCKEQKGGKQCCLGGQHAGPHQYTRGGDPFDFGSNYGKV